MLSAAANMRLEILESHLLPKELKITLTGPVAAACPTHILAVYSSPEKHQRQHFTLYPVHAIVLATHCANLPSFPALKSSPALKGTMNIPVLPLGLPSATTFPLLQSYLYTKRIDTLLSKLLPASPPS